ncbi:hypothetical protein BJY04DRAFT_101250 [Aspergillus karnatakaensis]|uniref:uncharacterized protein n=1 Tax=Aspergillus karnatakaensis TaxID=1810916 RepID=UPI003CCD9233
MLVHLVEFLFFDSNTCLDINLFVCPLFHIGLFTNIRFQSIRRLGGTHFERNQASHLQQTDGYGNFSRHVLAGGFSWPSLVLPLSLLIMFLLQTYVFCFCFCFSKRGLHLFSRANRVDMAGFASSDDSQTSFFLSLFHAFFRSCLHFKSYQIFFRVSKVGDSLPFHVTVWSFLLLLFSFSLIMFPPMFSLNA